MAGPSWRQGRHETSLADVLTAFSVYGGQLWGGRRSSDNPLALTHVQWQGPAGQILEAVRRSEHEAALSAGERDAWVQLALNFPNATAPVIPGPNAPWMPLSLPRETAGTLSAAISRSWAPNGSPGPSSRFHYTPYRDNGQLDRPSRLPDSWQTDLGEIPEVVAIPCIEVELPPGTGDALAAAYAQDYTRDVQLHFMHAAYMLPQVRELRTWMRGDRLVLAARMVLAEGARTPTRAEMDGAAQMLAAVLAQRTLPYARLTFAAPTEWQTGAPLPEP